jgi:hypothetical protein
VGFVKHHQKNGSVSYVFGTCQNLSICTASSLVGVTTNARICFFFDDPTMQLMYNRYMANAVFPVPFEHNQLNPSLLLVE